MKKEFVLVLTVILGVFVIFNNCGIWNNNFPLVYVPIYIWKFLVTEYFKFIPLFFLWLSNKFSFRKSLSSADPPESRALHGKDVSFRMLKKFDLGGINEVHVFITWLFKHLDLSEFLYLKRVYKVWWMIDLPFSIFLALM